MSQQRVLADRRSLERVVGLLVQQYGVYAVLHALVEVCHTTTTATQNRTARAPWTKLCQALRAPEDIAREHSL